MMSFIGRLPYLGFCSTPVLVSACLCTTTPVVVEVADANSADAVSLIDAAPTDSPASDILAHDNSAYDNPAHDNPAHDNPIVADAAALERRSPDGFTTDLGGADIYDATYADLRPLDGGRGDTPQDAAQPADVSVADTHIDDISTDDSRRPDTSLPDTLCLPNCQGKECGTDGCGGICATCPGADLCSSSGQCVDPILPAVGYEVGVDYHATGANFDADSFLTRYHQPAVRSTVIDQLNTMAQSGASVVSTRIWFVVDSGQPAETWKHHFPLTEQELDNIGLYAQDVANSNLKLYLHTLYLWCANYHEGDPATTLGNCHLSSGTFIQHVQSSVLGVLQRTRDIYLANGHPVLERFYLDGEVMTAVDDTDPATAFEKKNQRWFFLQLWPWFHGQVKQAGSLPMLYFIHGGAESRLLDHSYVDAYLPALNQHRSMYWMYRTLKFLQDNGLPIPDRIDFSCYPKPDQTNYATLIHRIFNDYDATIPDLLGDTSRDFFVAETYHFGQQTERYRVHKAFADQLASRPHFKGVTFWTTPYAVETGVTPVGPPFDFAGLLNEAPLDVSFGNADFETSATCADADGSANPQHFCTEWSNGNVTAWSIGQSQDHAHSGNSSLRLSFGECATSPCEGSDFPGVFVLSDAVTGLAPERWVMHRVWTRYSGPEFQAGVVLINNGNTVDSIALYPSDHFAEYVLMGPLGSDPTSLTTRFQILDPDTDNIDLYIDTLH